MVRNLLCCMCARVYTSFPPFPTSLLSLPPSISPSLFPSLPLSHCTVAFFLCYFMRLVPRVYLFPIEGILQRNHQCNKLAWVTQCTLNLLDVWYSTCRNLHLTLWLPLMFETLHCRVGLGVARPKHRKEQCSFFNARHLRSHQECAFSGK